MGRYRIGLWLVMTVLAAVSVPGRQPDSWAGKPVYSYMDDRGNLVATDRLEDLPLAIGAGSKSPNAWFSLRLLVHVGVLRRRLAKTCSFS